MRKFKDIIFGLLWHYGLDVVIIVSVALVGTLLCCFFNALAGIPL